MTKIVTATCLMQLSEKGQVKLDDDTRPLVPQLAAMQILRGFDTDDKPILEDNTKPIMLRQVWLRAFCCASKCQDRIPSDSFADNFFPTQLAWGTTSPTWT